MEQTYGEVCKERDELALKLSKTLQALIATNHELADAKIIGRAGGFYVGKQEMLHPDMRGDLYLFNAPITRTTLAIWQSDCEDEKIKVMIRASNAAFGIIETPPFEINALEVKS